MLQTRVVNVGAPLTIIGKDLDAGATFNADVTPGQGKLRAGTIMKYDDTGKALAKAVLGTDVPFGVLADEYDDTNAGGVIEPAMVYRDGVFLRQEIESANDTAIPAGGAVDKSLRDMGINLELSYEDYVGVNPVPTGAQVP